MPPFAPPGRLKRKGEKTVGAIIKTTPADISTGQTRAKVFEEVPVAYASIDKHYERREKREFEIRQSVEAVATYPHPDLFFVGETKLQDALYYNPIKKRLPPLSQLLGEEEELNEEESLLTVSNMTITSARMIRDRKDNSLGWLVQQSRRSRIHGELSIRNYSRTNEGFIRMKQRRSSRSVQDKETESNNSTRSHQLRDSLVSRNLQSQEAAAPQQHLQRRKSREYMSILSSREQDLTKRGSEASLQLADVFNSTNASLDASYHPNRKEPPRAMTIRREDLSNHDSRHMMKRIEPRDHHYQGASVDSLFDDESSCTSLDTFGSSTMPSIRSLHESRTTNTQNSATPPLKEEKNASMPTVKRKGSMVDALNKSKNNVGARSYSRGRSMESMTGDSLCSETTSIDKTPAPRAFNSRKISLESWNDPKHDSCSLSSLLGQHPRLAALNNSSSSRLQYMPKQDSSSSLVVIDDDSFSSNGTDNDKVEPAPTNLAGMIGMKTSVEKNTSFRPSKSAIRRLSMGAQLTLDEYDNLTNHFDESGRPICEDSGASTDSRKPTRASCQVFDALLKEDPWTKMEEKRKNSSKQKIARMPAQYDDVYSDDSLPTISRHCSIQSLASRDDSQPNYSFGRKSSMPGHKSKELVPGPLTRKMSDERLKASKNNGTDFRRSALMLRQQGSTRSILSNDSSDSLNRIRRHSKKIRDISSTNNANAAWGNAIRDMPNSNRKSSKHPRGGLTNNSNPSSKQDREGSQNLRDSLASNAPFAISNNKKGRSVGRRSSTTLTTLTERDLLTTQTDHGSDSSCCSGGSLDSLDYWANKIASNEFNPKDGLEDFDVSAYMNSSSKHSSSGINTLSAEDSDPGLENEADEHCQRQMRRFSAYFDASSTVLNTLDEDSEPSSERETAERGAVVSTRDVHPSESDTQDTQLQEIGDCADSQNTEASVYVDSQDYQQSESDVQISSQNHDDGPSSRKTNPSKGSSNLEEEEATTITTSSCLKSSKIKPPPIASDEICKTLVIAGDASSSTISDDTVEIYNFNTTTSSLPSNDTTCSESLSVESEQECTKQSNIFRYHNEKEVDDDDDFPIREVNSSEQTENNSSTTTIRQRKTETPKKQTVYDISIASLSVYDQSCEKTLPHTRINIPKKKKKNIISHRSMEDTDESNVSSFAAPIRRLRSMSFKSTTSTKSRTSAKSKASSVKEEEEKEKKVMSATTSSRAKFLTTWLKRSFTLFGRRASNKKNQNQDEEVKVKRRYFRKIASQ